MEETFVADREGVFEDAAAECAPGMTLGAVRRLIDSGALLLNDRRAERKAPVAPGDAVTFVDASVLESAIVPAGPAPAVLFEDASLIAVDKPSGVAVVPERNSKDWPMMASLLFHANECDLCREASPRFRIVHRLDRETSGALVVAKTLDAARALTGAFASGEVKKRYLAIVRGAPRADFGIVDVPLAKRPGGGTEMVIDSGGKPSRTEWRVVERFRGYALVEARPLTGRTHQVRVHLAFEGMALAVDALYGGREALFLSEFKASYRGARAERPIVSRLTLHCGGIEFGHPDGAGRVIIESPVPSDIERALKALRKYA